MLARVTCTPSASLAWATRSSRAHSERFGRRRATGCSDLRVRSKAPNSVRENRMNSPLLRGCLSGGRPILAMTKRYQYLASAVRIPHRTGRAARDPLGQFPAAPTGGSGRHSTGRTQDSEYSRFVPVRVVGSGQWSGAEGVVEIVLDSGERVRMWEGVSEETLRRAIRVL